MGDLSRRARFEVLPQLVTDHLQLHRLDELADSGAGSILCTCSTIGAMAEGIGAAAQAAQIPIWQNRVGTMFSTFFTGTQVYDWPSAKASDTGRFGEFFQGMLEQGIYIAPSQFEAGFMSSVHGEAEIEATIAAAERTFRGW